MKRFIKLGGMLVLVTMVGILAAAEVASSAKAASDPDDVVASLSVGASISNACGADVTMGGITSSGQSALASNEVTCTVTTNNSGGYRLEWQASAATMSANAGADTIAAYTPVTPGTPEAWSVAATASEWGARLKSTSTTYDSKWGIPGTDTYAANWLNVNNASAYTVVSRNSETAVGGDSEIIQFGAEVGASKFQPTGDYTVTVTFTATTL